MYKIAILGSENSHADAFIGIFNDIHKDLYPDIKVVAIGGHYADQNKRLAEKYNLEIVGDNYADIIKQVDAVMVTARDGKYHAQMARPFIEAGLPAFIDKPFTTDTDEALGIIRLARKKGVPLCGGSSVKLAYDVQMLKNKTQNGGVLGGSVVAPLSMDNPYGGFFFYAAHLAEMTMEIFGYNPIKVTAKRAGDSVYALVDYGDFVVANSFISGVGYYQATVLHQNGLFIREVDISLAYRHECDEFANMLRTGKMQHSYEQLAAPVFYLNAVYKAYTEGSLQQFNMPDSI